MIGMKLNRRGQIVVGVTMSVIAVMCAFPPFYRDFEPKFRNETWDYAAFEGYHFITKSDAEMAMLWQLRIDTERLLVQILFVAFVPGAVLFFANCFGDEDEEYDINVLS